MRGLVCVIPGCAGLGWHFSNFSWFCKVFLQTFLHFASQFRNLKAISKLGGDFAAKWEENSRSALHARLQMAITSSFHLQIVYRLKRWTPDFPIFETIYCMHHLSSRKCFKNVSNSCEMGYGCDMSAHGVRAEGF